MDTYYAPLVTGLFLFCYEREFMMSLSADNDAEIIEAFNSTSRYLDDLLNIDNTYFDGMVKHIYPSELQLNKANSSDTEVPFLDLHLIISDGFESSKIYDKSDDFDFDMVNFPFLDGHIPRATSYGVYISQLIRFAYAVFGVSSHVADFNTRIQILRGVVDKFVSFFHRIIIYGWIYIIFCHYQQQSVVNRKKTLKCNVWQICDITMTLMTSHVGDVVVKTVEDRCGWCTISGYKCYSTCTIIGKFSDNICT